MLRLEPVELFLKKAPNNNNDLSEYYWWSHFLFDCGYPPDVPLSARLPPECVRNQAWAGWEKHLIIAIGHAGPLEYLPRLENASTLQDIWTIMEKVAVPVLRIDGDRNDRARSDASSSSRDRRAHKGKAVDHTSSSDSLASSGETDEGDADPIVPDDHNFSSGGSPPLCGGEYGSSSQAAAGSLPEGESDESPPHCPFPETSTMDGGNTTFSFAELGVSSEQYSSALSRLYIPMPVERPFAAGVTPEGGPPPPDDEESPSLEIDALSGHGIEWPTKDQPGPYSGSDDFWNFLLGRVKAVTNAENPPPTEAIRGVLEENTMIAFNMGISRDCWMSFIEDIWGEVCRRDAKVAWAPYDQRIQCVNAVERERIARLQCELDEARSFLNQEAREAAEKSEEEATLARDGGKFRQSVSSKAKEVKWLKRKKPSCLYFIHLSDGECFQSPDTLILLWGVNLHAVRRQRDAPVDGLTYMICLVVDALPFLAG
ncbi:hypothetical protein Taro_039082 [Colocasia esculenta]|uniref:Uncharacterized protein n=1 Tax=Colocasia esculenta TaxID=4460 RepID=A0A843WQI9_COLES|nr:hypothetical protein [Colocasia esculenta]